MKTFLCMPVVVGNGSKYIATNLAHYTKSMFPSKSVALIDFDFRHPHLAEKLSLHDTTHSIDNLVDKIDGKFLSTSLFKENMITLKSGVELLKGTKITHNIKLIQRHHIEEIMTMLKETYDYVFISTSNEALAGTVYGLFEATDVILVARNNYANFKEFKKALNLVNHYKNPESNMHLIINQYAESSEVVFSEHLKDVSMKNVELVPYNEETFDHNDLDKGKIAPRMFKGKNASQEIFQGILNKIIEN